MTGFPHRPVHQLAEYLGMIVFMLILVAGPALFLVSLYEAIFTPAPILETIWNGLAPLFISIFVFVVAGWMVAGPRP